MSRFQNTIKNKNKFANKRVQESLKNLVNRLLLSAKNFDDGNPIASYDIAVHLRVLIMDNMKKDSALKSLNIPNLKFYDYSYDCEKDGTDLGLINISPNLNRNYLAPLDFGPDFFYKREKVSYNNWLAKVVIKNREGKKLTRKKIIKYTANKDGAHVDKNLPDDYDSLRKNEKLWTFKIGGVEIEINPVLVSIRQMCHEVLKSLIDEFGKGIFGKKEMELFRIVNNRKKPTFQVSGVRFSWDSPDGKLRDPK